MRRTGVFFAALVTATFVRTATAAELEFDHVWIVVSRDAPERAALERAGLKISPNVTAPGVLARFHRKPLPTRRNRWAKQVTMPLIGAAFPRS